tara:strand:- start:134 stop:322 length:189 start_codon:yes stop_codon:yes gene_type:complete
LTAPKTRYAVQGYPPKLGLLSITLTLTLTLYQLISHAKATRLLGYVPRHGVAHVLDEMGEVT